MAGFVVFIKQVQTGGIKRGRKQRGWLGADGVIQMSSNEGLIRRGGRMDCGHWDWGWERERE